MSKKAAVEPDDGILNRPAVEMRRSGGKLKPRYLRDADPKETISSPGYRDYGGGLEVVPDEPDDAQVKPARPRDVPSGKFADKRKGINMGDIK
jgi:hypothetical protein